MRSQVLFHTANIFLNLFCWSIIDLQYCVNFCHTAKWFSCTFIYTFFHTFPWWFIKDIVYSSLCYTVRPFCLSILNIIVPSANPKLPVHSCIPLHLHTANIETQASSDAWVFGFTFPWICIVCIIVATCFWEKWLWGNAVRGPFSDAPHASVNRRKLLISDSLWKFYFLSKRAEEDNSPTNLVRK